MIYHLLQRGVRVLSFSLSLIFNKGILELKECHAQDSVGLKKTSFCSVYAKDILTRGTMEEVFECVLGTEYSAHAH